MKRLKTIPTILGLLLILAGIGGGVYLVQNRPSWLLRAQPTATPQQLRRTNITDRSLTLSWTTQEALVGFVRYGSTAANLDMTVSDDRDAASGQSTAMTTHYVTLRGLNPGTTYYFKIGSGQTLYDNSGQPYQVTTAPTLVGSPPPSDVASGVVNQASGAPAEGAIVYLTLANASPLSALTTTTGSWVITLSNARSVDLSSYAPYDRQASTEEILVQAGTAGTATAVVTTSNDSPVPTIALGGNYDFRQAPTTPTATPTTVSRDTSGFTLDPIATPSLEPGELAIINPDDEESVATQRPEIFGQGPAGVQIEITVQSPATQSGTVISAEDGSWSWVPPDDLEPGEHTVTARYVDEDGLEHLVTRMFVVLAAGEDLPSFEATPSGEATTPTLTVIPTATTTGTPTSTPSGRVSIPSTEAGVPESGYLTPTFLLFIMGAVLVGAGIFSCFILKRKSI